ncbi:TetR/AcrR family transcriptional regulator [Skermania piniformis]|uniref:TetR/AcrR family transcriptional regulator n=1 Tax=Skermania pinensis TaxID=39122 RepID=A0ABX8SI32_9ACTN|nr:TetR/AcrR family transcriptional regulator [Skermania piniformis]QXQ15346.1 TetR/AcrR family transcriptional regulator [Skermania piniformis]
MTERWTRQRRVEHTRGLLLDAAETVFAGAGFGGAALEDIADAAGYTRGAIYAHFGSKEDLFLAVIDRHLERFMAGFAEVIESFDGLDTLDVDKLADRWRELTRAGPERAALGYEFSLFLLRNPDARDRLAERREQMVASFTTFIDTYVEQLGGALAIPADTLARILVATNEGITIAGGIDGIDLYPAFVHLVTANIVAVQNDKSADWQTLPGR